MAHRRKTFLVYPPNYSPGDGFKEVKTVKAAKREAAKMGSGANVTESIEVYKTSHSCWVSWFQGKSWDMEVQS